MGVWQRLQWRHLIGPTTPPACLASHLYFLTQMRVLPAWPHVSFNLSASPRLPPARHHTVSFLAHYAPFNPSWVANHPRMVKRPFSSLKRQAKPPAWSSCARHDFALVAGKSVRVRIWRGSSYSSSGGGDGGSSSSSSSSSSSGPLGIRVRVGVRMRRSWELPGVRIRIRVRVGIEGKNQG